MQVPLQISFHQLDHSDALESTIVKKVAQLEKICTRITSVRVTVGLSEHRHHQGKLYTVRIDLTLPGHNIVVDRGPSEHHAHEDPYVATRDAFRAARRQLEDFVRVNYRGKKRHHERPNLGTITHLLLEKDGGFITTHEGREIYFNKNSVIGLSYDQLAVGDEVRFSEEQGEKGPQASSLERVGKWGKHDMTLTPAQVVTLPR